MKNTSTSPVEFSCHAANAKCVFVAGMFNDWKPDATPLHLEATSGQWTVSLSLPPGHHEFKFVVDGQWGCEPGCEHEYLGCPKCVANAFGTMNRVLEVI
jgi:1,4-alpha-glucan branching enzyme